MGAPIRHHLAALRTLLRFHNNAIQSGGQHFIGVLNAHWQQSGRLQETEDSTLDVRLSLHSKNEILINALQYVQDIVDFDGEVAPLLQEETPVIGEALGEKLQEVMKRVSAEGVISCRASADYAESNDGSWSDVESTTSVSEEECNEMLTTLGEHVRRLHCLLIFDAWREVCDRHCHSPTCCHADHVVSAMT